MCTQALHLPVVVCDRNINSFVYTYFLSISHEQPGVAIVMANQLETPTY